MKTCVNKRLATLNARVGKHKSIEIETKFKKLKSIIQKLVKLKSTQTTIVNDISVVIKQVKLIFKKSERKVIVTFKKKIKEQKVKTNKELVKSLNINTLITVKRFFHRKYILFFADVAVR